MQGRIVRSGLISPGGHLPRAEHHRRATWAALTQGGGQRTPWGGDGGEGVLSRVSTAPQSEMDTEEKCRETVISVWFIKKGLWWGCERNWGLVGNNSDIQTEGSSTSHRRQWFHYVLYLIVQSCYVISSIGKISLERVTHLTLTLVQMIYSISSENGFWKVKELVLIQIHSRDLERNRNITDRTWPFSLTTCWHKSHKLSSHIDVLK